MWIKQLHDSGYHYIGDTALYKLALPEVRVLLEGANVQAERKAEAQGATQGKGVHKRAPGQHRESDEQWVADLARQQQN